MSKTRPFGALLGVLALALCSCVQATPSQQPANNSPVVYDQNADKDAGPASANTDNATNAEEAAQGNAAATTENTSQEESTSGETSASLANDTGAAIVSYAMRALSDEAYSDATAVNVAASQRLQVPYDPARPSVDLTVTLDNGNALVFRGLDLSAKNISLRQKEDVGYTSYTDASSGATVSTEDAATAASSSSDNIRTYDMENQAG